MGYQTALHLVDVKIKDVSVAIVEKALASKKARGFREINGFLSEACLCDDGYLRFKSTGDYECVHVPDEEDAAVPVLVGRWYQGEEIAEWLKLHSEKGGQLIQHSWEADGAAWD
jgi:hypothetical protein